LGNDEVLERLHRIYAALDATVEGDLSKFPPKVVSSERGFAMYQNFLGGLSPAQLSNVAHSVIHNIANLYDHLRKWMAKNGKDPKSVDQIVVKHPALQLVRDLSNNDKHDYPPCGGGHSGKAPKLKEVNRVLKLTTGTAPGSSVMVVFTSQGPKQTVTGGGGSAIVVTGTVVDKQNTSLGDLHDIEVDSLKAWEQELRSLGVLM